MKIVLRYGQIVNMEPYRCPICGEDLSKYEKKIYCDYRCTGIAKKNKPSPFKGRHHTEEAKRKNREAHIGELNYMYNRHHTKEARRKISESLLGKPAWCKGLTKETDERVKKSAEALLGRRLSEEHVKNLRKACIGKPSPMTGKHHTEKTKRLIGASQLGHPPTYPKLRYVPELGHSVRSKWEEVVARRIKHYKLGYSYEPESFEIVVDGKIHTYRPDFYISSLDLLIEVKGFFKCKYGIDRINTFISQYQSKKLLVITSKEIKDSNLLNCPVIEYENWQALEHILGIEEDDWSWIPLEGV